MSFSSAIKGLSQLSERELQQWFYTRWRCRYDLGFLCREVLGYKDVSDEIHGTLLSRLQQFPKPNNKQFYDNDRLENGKIIYKPIYDLLDLPGKRRFLILDSRGFLKTTINAQAHSIQWILNYPDIAMMIIQSNSHKSQLILREIKKHFQSNPVFRALFPEHCPNRKVFDWGTLDDFTTEARSAYNTRKESTMMVGSIDKGSAGLHFDVMKFSDIVEPNNSKTPDQCLSVYRNYTMMQNLLVSPLYWIDIEGTRYSFSDAYGKIIELEYSKPPDQRQFEFYTRGCFKQKTPDGAPQKFVPEELDLPFLLDDKGKRISWWEKRFPTWYLENMELQDVFTFNCSRSDQKILMADWTEKPICEVRPGDTIVGYVREGRKVVLRPSKVTHVGANPNQEFLRIELENGLVTYQTLDHRWYTGNMKEMYKEISYGSNLYSAFSTLQESKVLYPWLGGFFDGEGTVSGRYSLVVYQKDEALKNRFREEAANAGFVFREYVDKRRDVTFFVLEGGRSELRRFAVQTGSTKAKKFLDNLWGAQACQKEGKLKVKSLQFSGERGDAWFLTTETGNYIVSGLLSANCQQLNNPRSDIGGMVPFPVNDDYPKVISRKDFKNNVRIVYYEAAVDTAETVTQNSNYTAISVGGWSESGHLYVCEIFHKKVLPDEMIENLISLHKKYNLRRIKIEETGFVRGLKPSLTKMAHDAKVTLPLEFVKRDNLTSKIERIMNSLQPWYTSGSLRFLEDMPALDFLKKEFREFPSGEHNDILDTIADLFQGKSYFGRLRARRMTERDRKTDLEKWILGVNDDSPQDFEVRTGLEFTPEMMNRNYYDKTGGI